ncbi:MAG: C4-dicarboxylate ABC transporter permease [Bacillota bacterium]|nr:C4-dicarboxylate ABC transporter permease [Bacillota bacterium]
MKTEVGQKTQPKTKFKVPHTYVIIFSMVLIAFIGTYLIPAGQYARVKDPISNRTVVDPNSFKYIEQTPVKFFSFTQPHLFTSIHQGMSAGASIIFFIFIVAGAFNMIQGTGAIEVGIRRLALKLKDRANLIIPVMMAVFAVGGATIGMAEETIVFIPIAIALARALGFDALTGVGMIVMGAAAGFSAGVANPFTVGVAQSIAEVPMYSGAPFRLVMLATFLATGAFYVMRYAKKVKLNPELSLVEDLEKAEKGQGVDLTNVPAFTTRHILVLLTFVVGMGVMIYGVKVHEWYIQELATIFLMMGIFASLIGGSSPSQSAGDFVAGAKELVFGALIVGCARAILVVMTNGNIIDTVVHSLATSISGFPGGIAAILMYAVQVIINTFIPSGSGQAATTMPIMAPLADIIGLTRQTAVTAFHLGDGITNSIIPTSATLMSVLAISKIPYEKWFKWVLPIMGMWLGAGAIFMILSTLLHLQ